MPLDVLNIVASQVILRNVNNPPDAQTSARLSIASGLVPGPVGLVLPIVAGRAQSGGGGGNGGGGEGVLVPDVGGKNEADATKALEDSRLTVSPTNAFSTTAAKGTVVRQQPAANSVRPLRSRVTIIVSDGPPPANGGGGGGGGGNTVTKAEFDAAMKSLNDRIDQLIKAHGGDASGSQSLPAANPATSTRGRSS
jgi:hypothetical protein